MPESVKGDAAPGDDLLELRDVTVAYDNPDALSRLLGRKVPARPAVDHISLGIARRETLGLVGESGCGKSTIAKSVLLMNDLKSGDIRFQGKSVEYWKKHSLRYYSLVQMIWQDPFASLNQKMRIREIIRRPLANFYDLSKAETEEKLRRIIHLVGLTPDHLDMYPHELSGGGRQRITIARALISDPVLLLADEPTSALDVSIQAQILNLLKSLQREMNLTMLFISHNLSVISFLCDRVAVMYAGRIVEIAKKDAIVGNHRHWYTKLLFESLPIGKKSRERQFVVDLGELRVCESGCAFASRCINAKELCLTVRPELKDLGSEHYCACHFPR